MASCRLTLRVVPGASRTEVAGRLGDALKVRVAAPPEDGAANAALLAFLAGRLGLSRRAVTLVAGASSPRKAVAVEGLDAAEAEARLLG